MVTPFLTLFRKGEEGGGRGGRGGGKKPPNSFSHITSLLVLTLLPHLCEISKPLKPVPNC